MGQAKKHHYVPQFLLRGFTDRGRKHLWVFDKATQKTFRSNIEDVAAENRLYDFEIEGMSGTIEPGLARFESSAAEIINRIRQTDTIAGLTFSERLVVATFAVQLMMRTPHARLRLRDVVSQFRKAIERRGGNPDDLEQLRELTENEEKLFLAKTTASPDPGAVEAIFDKDWTLQGTEGTNFLISDNPIVTSNMREEPFRSNLGLASFGVEIHFPISSTRCLAIRCKSWKAEFITRLAPYYAARIMGRGRGPTIPDAAIQYLRDIQSGATRLVEHENVVFANSLQVSRSERFLYSASEDFSLPSEMLRDHPHLNKGPRVQVT